MNGTTVGSQVTIQITNAAGATAQITSPVAQLMSSYLYGRVDGDSFQFTSNGSWGPQITSNTDLINHLNDQFWLWTNVDMTATVQDNHYTSSLQPPAGQTVNVINVSVGELAGLVPIPAYKQAQLANLSNADKAAILRTNPFVASIYGDINASPVLNPDRFKSLHEHFQVMGPDSSDDPPAGFAVDTNTQDVHGAITGYMHQSSSSFALGTTVSFITSGSAFAGVQYQYTYQRTTQTNSGQITDAQGLLESKTTCWHQGVDLYWDSAFGTYLFKPTDAGSSDCGEAPGLMGHVSMPPLVGGRPSHKPASVSVSATMPDGSVWHTQSNAKGEFKFFGLPVSAVKGVQISGPRADSVSVEQFAGLSQGFEVSRTKTGDLVVVVPPPQCTFSTSCPFYQNQPPQYSLSCPAPSDFYSWSGAPINATTPPSGVLLATGSKTSVGSTAEYQVFIAACHPGSKDLCRSYSIYQPLSNWCYTRKPPPPAHTCQQCGSDKKCCPGPNGTGHVCVGFSTTCPALQ